MFVFNGSCKGHIMRAPVHDRASLYVCGIQSFCFKRNRTILQFSKTITEIFVNRS